MKVKQKRYYIDRSENDKVIFVTSGRLNKFVREVEIQTTNRIDEKTIGFDELQFQDEHSLTAHNACFLEMREAKLEECGLDAPYRFFWKHLCINDEYEGRYNALFRSLDRQRN
ncbi:MAG TPA: hypothetical protein VLA13_07675 [Massilibacterium sp.]|nr:hypothetical protein [Massilibacterium sp.]